MSGSYRRVDRDQQFLMPPDMTEWLAPGHLVWFILDVVEQLDTGVLHRRHPQAGPGRSAYDPNMVLALLLYSYAVGERSSRRIERLCGDHVAFRVLCAQDAPDHTTLARFRARHEEFFADLFTQVLVLCARAGMGRVGVVSIDGTKIAANASLDANRSEENLRAQVKRILDEAAAVDSAEDEEFGDARGDELPAPFADRSGGKERIRKALEQIEKQRRDEDELTEAAPAKAREYLRRVEDGQPSPGVVPRGVDPERAATARLARARRRQAAATDRRRCHEAAKDVEKAQADLAVLGSDAPGGGPAPAAERSPNPRQDNQTAQRAPTASAQANTTDPESRIMKTRHGWVQGFNAQIAVSDDHLILAKELTQERADARCFESMMTAAVAAADVVLAQQPVPDGQDRPGGIGVILADAGYLSNENLTS